MSTSEVVSVLQEETEKNELHKSIRSWAIMLVIFGGLSFVVNEMFDPLWGIVLIGAAILSWKIKTPAMFIIYSVIMGWAALSNIFAGILDEPLWLGLAIMQSVWTVATVKQYKKYRHLQTDNEARTLANFGKASGILSILCMVLPLVSCMGVFGFVFITEDFNSPTLSPQAGQLVDTYFTYVMMIANLAVLALGLGIAATTAKGNPKGWAISGIVMSSIILAGILGLAALGTVGLLVNPAGFAPLSA